MIWPRAILFALVSVAIAVAPVGAAWAGAMEHRGAGITGVQYHPEATSEPVVEAMHDCASKMKAATESHAPCCTKDLACPPEFCIAKCFQLTNAPVSSSEPVQLATMRLSATDQIPLPDWSSRPQPPPPRT